ncbi:MAG: restriction endonuclease [Chthoniobacterales bacterium]
MSVVDFIEAGECERCRQTKLLSRTLVCQDCLEEMVDLRDLPDQRKRRLGELARSENGIIRDVVRRMALETNQAPSQRKMTVAKLIAEGDRDKETQAIIERKSRSALRATPEEMAKSLPDNTLAVELREVSAELIRWLARHPDHMHQLQPRKFEEVVAEIIRDMGHEVHLQKQTRDGGRDIRVIMKTPFGNLLVLVECKRWAPNNPVSVDVVRSFLHVIRDGDKANVGIIATTARFSSDAKREARKFEWLLKLKDWEQIREWASHYGQWYRPPGKELWLPNDFLKA